MGLFSSKTKILIVEDEVDIAEGLKARLEMEGYEADIAHDGKSGVEMAKSKRPNLIILDVMLPIANGYEACQLIKKDSSTKSIPVLMLTALPHVEDAEKAFAAGANDFLNKPYTNERLLQKVRKLLEKSSA